MEVLGFEGPIMLIIMTLIVTFIDFLCFIENVFTDASFVGFLCLIVRLKLYVQWFPHVLFRKLLCYNEYVQMENRSVRKLDLKQSWSGKYNFRHFSSVFLSFSLFCFLLYIANIPDIWVCIF